MSRLKNKYREDVRSALKEKFDYKNVMMVPEVKKITLNMGIGAIMKEKNAIADCVKELALISGQQPVICRAKKSISNFKVRDGMPLGVMVTLRGKRMYDFMDRFFNIVCPRILDFRGLNFKLDGKGNYSIGITDHQIFPELVDDVKRTQGLNITFVTSAQTDKEGYELLKSMGMPYKQGAEKKYQGA